MYSIDTYFNCLIAFSLIIAQYSHLTTLCKWKGRLREKGSGLSIKFRRQETKEKTYSGSMTGVHSISCTARNIRNHFI